MSRAVITAAPCAKCPFRKDVPIYLRADRRADIAQALINQETFWCHQTVGWDEDDEGDEIPITSDSTECSGALRSLMLVGGTSQHARIAERLGLADLDRIEAHPVEVWGLNEWQQLEEGSTGDEPTMLEEIQTCSTVNPGCLAPAGYLGASGAVIEGTESADGECSLCGEPLCSNCADSMGRCFMCSEEDE